MKVDPQSIVRCKSTQSGGKAVARKTFVIDTNVLVHDPESIKKFKENDVVIPLIVLEELDGLKRHSVSRSNRK